MKKLISGLLFVCIFAGAAAIGYAQEVPKAEKMENHTWHQVVMVKFLPGKLTEAKQIITDHFAAAGMDADLPGPQIIEFKSGEWDMMFIWTMDSISNMDWEVTPDDAKWYAAMAKREGGIDKAMGLMDQYVQLIDRSTSYLATSQKMEGQQSMGQ